MFELFVVGVQGSVWTVCCSSARQCLDCVL